MGALEIRRKEISVQVMCDLCNSLLSDVVCGTHVRWERCDKVLRDGNHPDVSHGICAKCAEEMEEE